MEWTNFSISYHSYPVAAPSFPDWMRLEYGVNGPFGYPNAPWNNAVLKTFREVEESLEQVYRLGLPPVMDVPKNWDSLAALDLILRTTDPAARIFDAGGEIYSMILPWLVLYGYENLTAGNLTFTEPFQRGPIVYEFADIVRTKYPEGYFDAVACLSVIEHGVDPNAYFREMSRILRVGGVLITSTDYYSTRVDTRGQEAFGVPIHVFDQEEIVHILELSQRYGFALLSDLDLNCGEKVVTWQEYNLQYTFLNFSLQKIGDSLAE